MRATDEFHEHIIKFIDHCSAIGLNVWTFQPSKL
jgi:hypothetical protein